MSIKIGSISAKDIYIGSTPAKEIRLGSTLIWSRAQEEVYYTLTVNLEGDYEAYYDGYTIYVDGNELARFDSSSTFTIAAGSVVSLYNNSYGINGYTHSEAVVPAPNYNDDLSWVMDKDYTLTVTATKPIEYYTLDINLGDGVDYTDIMYKEPGATEWTNGSKLTELTVPAGTQFYIYLSLLSGYELLNSDSILGTETSPLVLNGDITIDIYPTVSETEQYELNVVTDNGVELSSLAIYIDGLEVFYKDVSITDESLTGTSEPIIHNGQQSITVVAYPKHGSLMSAQWSGMFAPSLNLPMNEINWEFLPESGTLVLAYSS